jgi:HEAT repeat protein
MPNQKSVSGSRVSQTIANALGFVLLFLCAAGSVHAQSEGASSDFFSTVFSTYSISILMVLVLVGLIVYKKYFAPKEWEEVTDDAKPAGRTARTEAGSQMTTPTSQPRPAAPADQNGQSEAIQLRPQPLEVEPSVYGAYRIDQEVAKLLLGKPHRMDVMASRAVDDRRAIEASLMKALDSSEVTEEGCGRVRRALEEYGFVARQSASLLLGRDAWERSSAARVLGQVRSQSSLPFLMEALHDGDPVVRNQAIASLGELKMPAAIGALLDIARRHPDIPASLLSETLSACSVESLGYLDSPSAEPAVMGNANRASELPDLESLPSFEELPAGQEDESVAEILAGLDHGDKKTRGQVAQQLGLHATQRSVSALSELALTDNDPAVRAASVSSLGSIDHESVFAPVLIALADESREVRAAAARTLTSLHFDRADAYVRVMESADRNLLHEVAQACIKTGIVAQAVDRLASEDRRQAYEAFSLFSLLARAGEIQPILNAVENHHDDEVRLCAIRVLNACPPPQIASQLRELVALENTPESVRTALLEVLYKLDQDEPVFDIAASDNVEVSLHNPR